jgi:hypothetical protein
VDFSGHSLRSGFLTSAARRGASVFKMRDVSRHKSMDVLQGYWLCARRRAVPQPCRSRIALKVSGMSRKIAAPARSGDAGEGLT